ncbi:MAG: hypothetical protein ABJN34_00870 [Litoreibacter sp.]|uniref:hypothetical protein n=1 Tax=Litoreibacter sp. TaxID=1969459 RepID=UPI003296A0CF
MSYCVGQVWTFPETEDRPQLVVTIGRIDTAADLGAEASNSSVLSVSMTPSEEARKLDWPEVGHTPIAETAFNADGQGELVMDDVTPPNGFSDGYAAWRESFDEGRAGVFTVSPPDAYAAILQIYADNA